MKPGVQIFDLKGINSKLGLTLLVTVCLSVLGFFIARDRFFVAYLHAYSLCLSLALGCIGLGLLHNLVGGRWGDPLRGVFEAGSKTVIAFAVLFVPIFLGRHVLYPWTNAEYMASEPALAAKVGYLNMSAFLVRALVYFAVWFMASRVMTQRKQGASGFFMLLFVVTLSFAAFDWLMSTEPTWFSSIYGAIYLAGSLISTLVFLILLVHRNEHQADFMHDLGKLLLMAVMVWAYFSFSQYLIIWSGKLPEELTWYEHRTQGGWKQLGLLMIIGHFLIPFFLLLSRNIKRSGKLLVRVAIYLIVLRVLEAWWLIGPAFYRNSFQIHWLNLVLPLCLLSLFLFLFSRFYAEKVVFQPVSRDNHGPQDRH